MIEYNTFIEKQSGMLRKVGRKEAMVRILIKGDYSAFLGMYLIPLFLLKGYKNPPV